MDTSNGKLSSNMVAILLLEVKSLKKRVKELEDLLSKENIGKTDCNKKEIMKGDIVEIMNNHNGLMGTIVKVTKVMNDRVYFVHNKKNTWRKSTNLKILHKVINS